MPYTAVRIDTERDEQHSPTYAALNPARAIPVIADDDGPGGERLVLPQAGAILLCVAGSVGASRRGICVVRR